WILARDLHPSALVETANVVVAPLVDDPNRGVRQAAALSLGRQPGADVEAAWLTALSMIPQRGGPGIAATNALARLSWQTGPTDVVDPVAAMEIVLAHRPEQGWRVWTAWRAHLPFRADWFLVLMRETVGYGPRLLRHWAKEDPQGLDDALAAWEPGPAHSERFTLI